MIKKTNLCAKRYVSLNDLTIDEEMYKKKVVEE